MPVRNEVINQVVNQMMKGPHHGRLIVTAQQRELFKLRHQKQIEWVLDRIPTFSCAVGAVLTKCIIRYGQEKVAKFCAALEECNFEGVNDPALVLWRYLKGTRSKSTIEVYQRTVCAARAYLEGRKLNSLRPAKEDIFDWDEGFTVPDEFMTTWNPDKNKEVSPQIK